VARGRTVSTLAAVSRVSVLGACVTQAVAVDVSQVPLLAGLDALVAASAVNEASSHKRGECPALGAVRCAVFAAIWPSPLAPSARREPRG
jgi:hypothetical protein